MALNENLLLNETIQLVRFETRKYSIGPYLVSIDGLKENSESLKRWTIYVFPPEINHAKPTKETLLETGKRERER